jgi:hypothetical protein
LTCGILTRSVKEKSGFLKKSLAIFKGGDRIPSSADEPHGKNKTTMKTLDQLREHYETLILGSKLTDCGCVIRDTQPIFSLANVTANPPRERGNFPKFTLIIDGESIQTNSRSKVEQILQCVSSGEKFRIFRNAGNGATIQAL